MLNIDCEKFRQVFGVTCENPNDPEAETKDALYMISLLYEFPKEDIVRVIGFICASFSKAYPASVAKSPEALEFFTFLYAEALGFVDGEKEGNIIELMTQPQISHLLLWLKEALKCKNFELYLDEIEYCIEVAESQS